MNILIKAIIISAFPLLFSCVKPADRKLADRDIEKLAKSDERIKAFYPHTDEFKRSTHSKTYFMNREKDLCSICHGSDFKGGNVKVSCFSCHNYPHDPEWKNKEAHGKVFKESWKDHGLETKIKDKNYYLCIHCHDSKGDLRSRNSNIDVPDCKKCHKVSVPHELIFKDSMHHDSHGKLAARYLSECKVCHLGEKTETAKMKDYKELLKPSELKLEKIEGCANCHREMKIKNKDLKDSSSWTVAGLNSAKLNNPNCKICHKEGKEAVLIDKKSLESPNVNSCAACHKADETPMQKLLVDKELTEEELDGLDQKKIKIIWEKRDLGK